MLMLVAFLSTLLAFGDASLIPGGAVAYSTSSIIHGGPGPLIGPHGLGPLGYHGVPLSLPHHAPAVVLGPNGVPLDTPEVVAARNAHLQAKALAGAHILHKRSIGLWGPAHVPAAASWTGRVDLPTKIIAAPAIIKAAPVAWGPAHGAWAPAHGAWGPAHGAWGHAAWPAAPLALGHPW